MKRFLIINGKPPESLQGGAKKKVAGALTDPRVIVSWNVNGLIQRVKIQSQWEEFRAFVKREQPDVICIQETKLVAKGNLGAKKGDGSKRWQGELNTNDKTSQEEANLIRKALALPPLDEYKPVWSLADWRYSGQCWLLRKGVEPEEAAWRFSPHLPSPSSVHNPEGRFMFAEFKTFALLSTYTPNAGWDETSNKRTDFDRSIAKFLKERRQSRASGPPPSLGDNGEGGGISIDGSDSVKPVIWVGDLNCAPTDADLSHPSWFKAQVSSGMPGPSSGSGTSSRFKAPDRKGQPGCQPFERRLFSELLAAGDLVDVFRLTHGEGGDLDSLSSSDQQQQQQNGKQTGAVSDRDTVGENNQRGKEGKGGASSASSAPFPIEGPFFTWRGTPGLEFAEKGKYYAKGMRIDHALVQRGLVDQKRVVEIRACGKGAQRAGFMGSDHCPLLLRVAPSESPIDPGSASATSASNRVPPTSLSSCPSAASSSADKSGPASALATNGGGVRTQNEFQGERPLPSDPFSSSTCVPAAPPQPAAPDREHVQGPQAVHADGGKTNMSVTGTSRLPVATEGSVAANATQGGPACVNPINIIEVDSD
uniref:Endonuclease/exonuclease/phosphatase domain-containing protein n=1 Tax=Chromera velia CCMP2878 TaxID=1169474 RepID=A0A0G4IED9_9ALVE|eukprot:Cvel_13637.t1-p1 / transcript=Cvel_13637.t1 / gene=Cvel_13637 / organism=Chromera_velia_CCMP2878 / gene_product=Exodeoxyribonuclease, putative / transcript_product=Exodeoxyribonuclease, putative / location=Cvel_scaffold940:17087-18859(+) / protein_length=591 / sequence_SO=supercontig / SO=protein_coding / is_pseudo=false